MRSSVAVRIVLIGFLVTLAWGLAERAGEPPEDTPHALTIAQ